MHPLREDDEDDVDDDDDDEEDDAVEGTGVGDLSFGAGGWPSKWNPPRGVAGAIPGVAGATENLDW